MLQLESIGVAQITDFDAINGNLSLLVIERFSHDFLAIDVKKRLRIQLCLTTLLTLNGLARFPFTLTYAVILSGEVCPVHVRSFINFAIVCSLML